MSVHHPVFARFYSFISPRVEKLVARHREELLAGLGGRVIEVGAGNGLNFARYPAGVAEVVAVEPEPYLRPRAEEAAARAAVKITVVEGEADALPGADGEFDAAVASLVLCSVPDQATALAEIRRVVKPGGELRVFEHVAADEPRLRRWQDRFTGLWRRANGGCTLNRDTAAAIAAAGFDTSSLRRDTIPRGGLTRPIVVGIARRPA